MLPNGLPRSRRLHLKRDFERIIQGGLKYHTSGLVLWGEVSHQAGPARFAVVVSKKLGPAVVRNRTKRILREAFRTLPVRLKPGANLIVKPQDSEKLSNVQAARMALMSLCEKAALLIN
jgi:ribonuclease P protein component